MGSYVLDRAKTPAQWVQVFTDRGIPMSERTLRSRARNLAACHIVGAAMLITPEQIDRILEDGACHLPRISEAPRGGPRAGSNATASQSRATSAKQLARLQKLARGSGSASGRKAQSGTT